MEYVAIAILAVLIIAGLIGAVMMRATSASTPASAEEGDPTPVGDTPQTADADAGARGAGGHAPARDPEEHEGNRFKSDPIGGEAEGQSSVDTGSTPRPS